MPGGREEHMTSFECADITWTDLLSEPRTPQRCLLPYSVVSARKQGVASDKSWVAEIAWTELWSESRTRQRDFFQFGGEYLETIPLSQLREFFGEN